MCMVLVVRYHGTWYPINSKWYAEYESGAIIVVVWSVPVSVVFRLFLCLFFVA